MKPKRKSKADLVIGIIVLILVLFASIHLAKAYNWAKKNPKIKVVNNEETEKFNIGGFFTKWGNSMSEEPFNFGWNQYSVKALLIGGFGCLLVLAYRATSKKKYISGKEHGTAEWGDESQILSLKWKAVKSLLINRAKEDLKKSKKLIKKNKGSTSYEKTKAIGEKEESAAKKIKKINMDTTINSEIILAKNVSFSIYNQDINSNVMIYGGSGAGKSRGIVMPNILNLAGTCSFVITDPKGEIYQKSRYFLQKQGYKVRCINLFEKYRSAKYNPLSYIHKNRANYDWQEDVLTLIETMIVNLNGGEGKKSSDPFWDDSAKHFIQSLFFFTMYMLDEKNRNMNSIMALLGMLEIGEGEDNFDSPLDEAFKLLRARFGEENIAYRTYKDFRTKASGKTAKSIAMTMVSKLQPYNIASMQALTMKDDMLLDRVGEELTAIFVIVPPVSSTFNFVAGMLFSQLFQELNYCANALHGGRLPIPVQFIMDEFANTCVIPNFEKIIAYARSLGIGIMPILQSRAQLKGMYEKSWETISDNCASTVFLGSINSEDTLKAFSERLGKGTYDERDVSVSQGRNSSTSISHKKIGRELMTPAEIAAMPKQDCLVFITGKNPMYCQKYDYPKHPRYIYTSDFDSKFLTLFDYEEENENEIKLPHGEEVKKRKKAITETVKDKAIKVENNPEIIEDYIKSRYIGGWQIISDNSMIIEEGENEESLFKTYVEIKEQEQEEEQAILETKEKIDNIYKELEKNRIKVTTDEEKVANVAQEMLENKESIGFVTDDLVVTEEGESFDELYFEDDSEEVESLLSETKDLEAEMTELQQFQQQLIETEGIGIFTDEAVDEDLSEANNIKEC